MLTAVSGRLYFQAILESIPHLYSYNPATGIAQQLLSNGDIHIKTIDAFNSLVVAFFGDDVPKAWVYNPAKPVSTGANPYQLIINGNPEQSTVAEALAVYGNRLYLSANDGIHGQELWVYEYYE